MKTAKYIVTIEYHCLYSQCQDTFKEQDAGLVTVAEEWYYCNSIGENGGAVVN